MTNIKRSSYCLALELAGLFGSLLVKLVLFIFNKEEVMNWEYFDTHSAQHSRKLCQWFIENYVSKICLPDKCVVLDVGCASGKNTHDLLLPCLPKGGTLYAVDIDAENIERAKKAYPQSEIQFVVLNALDLSQLGVKFDLIVSAFCFHLIPDQVSLWKSLTSVLKPSGIVMVKTIARNPRISAMIELGQTADYEECLKDMEKVYPKYLLKNNDLSAVTNYRKLIEESLPLHHVTFSEKSKTLPFKSRNEFYLFLKGVNHFNNKMDCELEKNFLNNLIDKMQEIQLQTPQEYCFLYSFLLVKVQAKQKL